ncbi:MAG TPA: hypothetical protein VFF73_17385, partial [Planctomycetota bacterium]|nr:hypothetical protein [Planctomycetota bacterium]
MKHTVAVVLALAVIIAGCRHRTRYLPGGGLELPRSQFPATPIAENNLADDGGGFSANNQTATLQELQVVFNDRDPTSDSPHDTADGSALVFFVTGDNGTTPPVGREHVFVSHWGSNAFTPPVEITGPDRDEAQVVGAPTGTHAASVLLIPLNTAQYRDQDGFPDPIVRQNEGDWLIVWDANTETQSPELSTGPGADANGVHHTLYANVFVASLERTPMAVANIGGNASTACEYGFQVVGAEVVSNRGGASAGGVSGAGLQAGFVNAQNQVFRPAEDVVSYGAATDAFVHCARFGSTVGDPSGLGSGGTAIGNVNGGLATLGATPAAATYRVGDDTSFIQLFWVQLVTSHAAVVSTFEDATGTGAVQIGPTFQLFTANFALGSLTLSDATQVPFPAQRGAGFSTNDARRLGATQALAGFTVYNNLVFWNYVDVSLQVPVSAPGTVEAQVGTNPGGALASSLVLSEVAVVPDSFGIAALVPQASQEDVTLLGTGGRHATTPSTPPGAAAPVDRGEELVSFDPCARCAVIGPDEGQLDVVAFVIGRDTTFVSAGGGTAGDTDRELWAVAFAATGSGTGILELMPNNPKRVSAHVAELPSGPILHDDVFDLKIQSSRDGTYDLLAWR